MSRLENITKDVAVDDLVGTKSEWEKIFEKIAKNQGKNRRSRPRFSPTDMQFIEEKVKYEGCLLYTSPSPRDRG